MTYEETYGYDFDSPEESNELNDRHTQRLLNEVCRGVNIPSDEEIEEAFHAHH